MRVDRSVAPREEASIPTLTDDVVNQTVLAEANEPRNADSGAGGSAMAQGHEG